MILKWERWAKWNGVLMDCIFALEIMYERDQRVESKISIRRVESRYSEWQYYRPKSKSNDSSTPILEVKFIRFVTGPIMGMFFLFSIEILLTFSTTQPSGTSSLSPRQEADLQEDDLESSTPPSRKVIQCFSISWCILIEWFPWLKFVRKSDWRIMGGCLLYWNEQRRNRGSNSRFQPQTYFSGRVFTVHISSNSSNLNNKMFR